MSILSEIFGGKNPQREANKYYNQIPGVGHQAYDPYISQGQQSGANAHKQFEEMMNDPQGFINKIMQGYKESDAYKFKSGELGKSMSNTAAAGGIAGTPLDRMNQAEGIQGLLSEDMQQWLSNVLGRYDTGLQGEEGEATRGYDASGKLTDILGGVLNKQGDQAFSGAQQSNSNRNAMIKALMTALGGAAGGPFGAAAGMGLAGPMSGSSFAPWQNPG